MVKDELSSLKQIEQSEIVTLCDGTAVTIRPICLTDAPGLQALVSRLSIESSYCRFLVPCRNLPFEMVEHMATVDYQTRMAFVAVREEDREESIIAEASYSAGWAGQPAVAEAAMVVEDRYQRRGLGTLLAMRLVVYARSQGIRTFVATVHPSNVKILRFIRRSGLPVEQRLVGTALEVRMGLDTALE